MRSAIAAALVVAALTGCATKPTTPPEPSIRAVEVKVAVPVPCPALDALGPEPAYPDTDAAIAAAPTIGQAAALYRDGRLMRIQRLAEYLIARSTCVF